ncbi:MAG TPA: hypothetical protein VLG46_17535 [Anaerolineae bacterium]|nr:hypothetical protein [Anaerolineae bacterium]
MHKLPLVFAAVLLFTLSVGCTTVNPTPNSLDSRPADFSIVYKWQEGSLPPPYHYEYTVTIDPNGQGQIVMVPDYSFSNPPTWTETFALTTAALDQLYRLLIDKGVFTQRWQAQQDPPVGGSYDSLHITAQGRQIAIPSFVIQTQAAAAEDISAAIQKLVPATIWNKLDTQREQYMTEHSK